MRIFDFRFSIFDWNCRASDGMARRSAVMLALGVVFVLMSGCRGQSHQENAPSGTPLTRTAQEGPVTLTLTVQPVELPFTERASVTVEAVAETGVTVSLASYETAIAQGEHQFEFRLRKLGQKNAEPMPGGKLAWSQSFEIEFFLPGEYELPPATLTFVEVNSANNAKNETTTRLEAAIAPRELKTEAIKVVARPTQAAELAPEELKKIQVLPPVELKEPWSRWWLVALPAGLAVAAIALILLLRRKRELASAVEYVPAHAWARRQIAALVAADLISKGQVQEFYYRISAIVRGYIERRYGVSAPEMTTEEFLAATAGDFRFAAGSATELQAFLTACDLVKYARHRPEAGEWNDLLRSAAQFVERTREVDVRNTVNEAATETGAMP